LFGRLEVDDELKLRCLLYRQISRFGAFEFKYRYRLGSLFVGGQSVYRPSMNAVHSMQIEPRLFLEVFL
jgi:hypothetical protein